MQLEGYGDVRVVVGMRQYFDGSPAMEITSDEGPVAMMSVYAKDAQLGKNEILIKGWSENKEIFQEMLFKNILLPIRSVPTGHVEATVCMLGDIDWNRVEIY